MIGREVAPMLGIGSAGDPIAATDRKRAALEVSYFSGLGALIVFVGGVAVARLAVLLASDVEALARVEEARAVAEPSYSEPAYVSGLEESPEVADVSSGALTKPRVDRYGPEGEQRRGWRRQRAAEGSAGAPYLRWPHPQG